VKEWFGTAARLVTGAVWIWAGMLKLPHPEQSVLAVRAYQLLPGDSATPVGHLLPVLEVVVGGCLVLGLLTRGAAALSALLFAAFIFGIASVWARGISIDCGCFGGGGYDANAASHYPWEIARDVGLLALSLYLVWQGRTRLALDNLLFPERTDPALELDPDDDDVQHSGV
jgi:uncharacterized membrane protein YphA (DoxX/SURF4 family)